MTPMLATWGRERVIRFLNTGVVGLRAVDDRRDLERQKRRKPLAIHLRAKGRPMPPIDRRGRDRNGTLIAYEELNDRVAMALRKLQEREERL